MVGEITKSEVWMLGINLPNPFPLAFGTLSTLPRVFLIITCENDNGDKIKSIGEASIDFPFSHYDAWDIYYLLSSIDLKGININDRLKVLNNPRFRTLLEYPAAFAALNMALDDAYGKLNNVSIPSLYGISRTTGQILESISTQSDASAFARVLQKGNVPKLKGGLGIIEDAQRIQTAILISGYSDSHFAVDFNAAYSVDQFITLIQKLAESNIDTENILFFEQPTSNKEGVVGLSLISERLKAIGLSVPVMADESFITADDALTCQQQGILLNYKIQKIGGILIATEIEKSLGNNPESAMVGGTFPTAIGRVWDQQALCILQSTNLPSDGWQPSTDWFNGERHLIDERFPKTGTFFGNGLGITIRWDRLEQYKLDNPKAEYQLIRNNLRGKHIQILLNKGTKYSDLYEQSCDKPYDWNL